MQLFCGRANLLVVRSALPSGGAGWSCGWCNTSATQNRFVQSHRDVSCESPSSCHTDGVFVSIWVSPAHRVTMTNHLTPRLKRLLSRKNKSDVIQVPRPPQVSPGHQLSHTAGAKQKLSRRKKGLNEKVWIIAEATNKSREMNPWKNTIWFIIYFYSAAIITCTLLGIEWTSCQGFRYIKSHLDKTHVSWGGGHLRRPLMGLLSGLSGHFSLSNTQLQCWNLNPVYVASKFSVDYLYFYLSVRNLAAQRENLKCFC